MLVNIHSTLAYDVPRTDDVRLPTKFRFNVRPATQPIAVLNLTHNLQRWPDIETALSDFTVFSDCCILMRVMPSIPAPETPDNTIHWPNGDVMLGHRLR